MTKTIQFIGVNGYLEHLRDKKVECVVSFLGHESAYEGTNMHELYTDDGTYLFDIKGCVIDGGIFLHGILQDKETIGKAAIQIF